MTLPIPDGALNFRPVLPGLWRSANLSFLTPRGRRDLLARTFSRIIDLRDRSERAIDAPLLVGHPSYLNLPLLPWRDRELNTGSAAAQTNADYYRLYLDRAGNGMVAVLGALLDAPPGPLLIHCHVGKDRTGLVAALLQELCGVPRQVTAADYTETDSHMGAVYDTMLARLPTGPQRDTLAHLLASRPEDILAALEHLDRQWGGVAAYLAAWGLPAAEVQALRQRLMVAV
jgi:protein-tyrosine phosphatase